MASKTLFNNRNILKMFLVISLISTTVLLFIPLPYMMKLRRESNEGNEEIRKEVKGEYEEERTNSDTERRISKLPDNCHSLFSIDKGKTDIWDIDENYYKKLSSMLPSLLQEVPSSVDNRSHYKTSSETRLQLLSGKIPYVPCQVVQYDSKSFNQCVRARKELGSETWIGFLGDSNGRLKMLELLSFLPKNLYYKYYLGDMEVTKQELYLALAYPNYRPSTFDVLGYLPDERESDASPFLANQLTTSNISSVSSSSTASSSFFGPSSLPPPFPAPPDPPPLSSTSLYYSKLLDTKAGEIYPLYSNEVDYNMSKSALFEKDVPSRAYELRITMVWASFLWNDKNKIKEWTQEDPLPDVIVISFGLWMLLLREVEEADWLLPFTELDVRAREVVKIVSKFAAKTLVLLWELSRYRWFTLEDERRRPHFQYSQKYWEKILANSKFDYGIPLLSNWVWRILKEAGVWRWDSSLPFSLANLRECETLSKAGIYDHTYYGMWWSCDDRTHSSFETSNNELQMLLNLLCNKYVANNRQNCCSWGDLRN